VYHIFTASIQALKPDIIITQDQCRICAVTKDDVQEACALLGDRSTQVVSVHPITLDDVLGDVMTIAQACGVPERGARLVRFMKERMETVRSTINRLNSRIGRPKVAHLEWIAPLMGSGYWIAECIDIGGGEMICGKAGGNSAVLEGPEHLKEADVIIIAPCGFSLERTKAELDSCNLLVDQSFLSLPAIQNGRCFVADGNKYFNRSSCGVMETAEMVAEMCHVDLLGLWGHHGQCFVNLKELDKFCARPDAPAPAKAVPGPEMSHGPHPAVKNFTGKMPHAEKKSSVVAEGIELGPQDLVKAQLAALKATDFEAAFALNSEQNKARLSSASKFASIVRGTSFNVLLDHSAIVSTAEPVMGDQLGSKNSSASVRVDVVATSGQMSCFFFDLGKPSTQSPWATEGVRIEC
jgi:iron complex transport system substrate-binding protein